MASETKWQHLKWTPYLYFLTDRDEINYNLLLINRSFIVIRRKANYNKIIKKCHPSRVTHSCRRSGKFLITSFKVSTRIAAILLFIASFKFGIVRDLPAYSLDVRFSHKKKEQEVKLGEWRGHRTSLFLEIKRHGNVSRVRFIETLAVWAVAPSYWNQIF